MWEGNLYFFLGIYLLSLINTFISGSWYSSIWHLNPFTSRSPLSLHSRSPLHLQKVYLPFTFHIFFILLFIIPMRSYVTFNFLCLIYFTKHVVSKYINFPTDASNFSFLWLSCTLLCAHIMISLFIHLLMGPWLFDWLILSNQHRAHRELSKCWLVEYRNRRQRPLAVSVLDDVAPSCWVSPSWGTESFHSHVLTTNLTFWRRYGGLKILKYFAKVTQLTCGSTGSITTVF